MDRNDPSVSASRHSKKRKNEKKGKRIIEPWSRSRLSFGQEKTDLSSSVITVIAEVARHGLRTEGRAVWRKLTLLDASTTGENLDESIFTRVTKCRKKHAFTRSRPRSHSRRRASDFTRALARTACAPPPTTAPHRCTTQRTSG